MRLKSFMPLAKQSLGNASQEVQMYETLSSNKCSRFNPVPSIYLYSALVQLFSTLIVDEAITPVLRYIYIVFRYLFIYLIGIFVLHFSSEFQTQVEPVSYYDFHSRL